MNQLHRIISFNEYSAFPADRSTPKELLVYLASDKVTVFTGKQVTGNDVFHGFIIRPQC